MKADRELDAFTRAYIECALWSSSDNTDDDQGGDPLDKNYGTDDIAPETFSEMKADCARFQAENTLDLAQVPDRYECSGAEQAGHDFWLSRNGHGTGFFDRDNLPKNVRLRLQEAAKAFGQYYLYVGDDGLIYGDKG